MEGQKYLAVTFLAFMDKKMRYRALLSKLSNRFLKGQKSYPETLKACYKLVTNFWDVSKKATKKQNAEDGKTANSFPQQNKAKWKCHCCGEKGHAAKDCKASWTDAQNKKHNNSRENNSGPTTLAQAEASDRNSRWARAS